MNKTLLILEVSRKQDYIFSSQHLKDNAARSDIIRHVTSTEFFEEAASAYYDKKENFVYAGGGHTILQFDDAQTARKFAEAVTERAMRQYDGIELFAKQMPYNEADTPGNNLKALAEVLEKKKALRQNSFRLTSLGIEDTSPNNDIMKKVRKGYDDRLKPAGNWKFAEQFEDLSGKTNENFIAVVHIDGNAMGTRVQDLYTDAGDDWKLCCEKLRRFSDGIQNDFEAAFKEMAEEVARYEADNPAGSTDCLPVRPVILAGDDVCFVARGCIALECAEHFMKHLAAKQNAEDGKHYAACAGVAIVHQKYPFHQAYNLAEALCSSAKKYGSSLCDHSSVSAMDWHIEFGQLKENLGAIRRDYETEDGKRMELRPVVVLPGDIDEMIGEKVDIRTYAQVRNMCIAMQQAVQDCGEKIARGKLKELRSAVKQGELECRYAMQDSEITALMERVSEVETGSATEIDSKPFRTIDDGGRADSNPVSHCRFFDAIEIMDHFERLEGNA